MLMEHRTDPLLTAWRGLLPACARRSLGQVPSSRPRRRARENVLMMWRHRFIINRWVWELPGGYVDPDEDPAATAAHEVEEETGRRPAHRW
ncbi:NUDIX domain-containing protein [Kribbella alba]|uniref:NUDIX domain-containing protein n=1 Tax=Kribbella alba TaxID=190197 RepID=UPI0031E2D235